MPSEVDTSYGIKQRSVEHGLSDHAPSGAGLFAGLSSSFLGTDRGTSVLSSAFAP